MASILANGGWRSKSGVWYRDAPDLLAMLELQKSAYDSQHFLNLGFFFPRLERNPTDSPSMRLAHIRCRADRVIEVGEISMAEVLRENEQDQASSQWKSDLEALISEKVMPYFENRRTLVALSMDLGRGAFSGCFVRADAHELLSSQADTPN